MSKSFIWKGISLVVDSNLDNKAELICALKKEGIELRDDILENQPNYFIFENQFISQSTDLSMMFAKYTKKSYEKDTKVYEEDNSEFKDIKAKPYDIKKYKKIISQNILDGETRAFDISVNILNEVLDDSTRSKLFLDVLILLALANKSSYDAENLVVEFKTEHNYYKTEISIVNDEPLNLYKIYDWIINDDEYEDSYGVKLHVVRQVIATKQDIKEVDGILEDSKLAYKRIISKKTDDYFDQLNQLKDDFLILSQNQNTALRTLHVTFFAWLGYLGIELFNIITKYEEANILYYLFCSQGIKKGIVIFMFGVALCFIFIGYVLEIKSLKKTYNVIKKLYKDKILFEADSDNKSKFETIIEEPKIEMLQIIMFIIITLSLCVRFLIAVL